MRANPCFVRSHSASQPLMHARAERVARLRAISGVLFLMVCSPGMTVPLLVAMQPPAAHFLSCLSSISAGLIPCALTVAKNAQPSVSPCVTARPVAPEVALNLLRLQAQ